jgi:hypothetical protein
MPNVIKVSHKKIASVHPKHVHVFIEDQLDYHGLPSVLTTSFFNAKPGRVFSEGKHSEITN